MILSSAKQCSIKVFVDGSYKSEYILLYHFVKHQMYESKLSVPCLLSALFVHAKD